MWEAINEKYIIYYDKLEGDNYLKQQLVEIFKDNVFTDVIMASNRQVFSTTDENTFGAFEGSGVQYVVNKELPYGLFLRRISSLTNLPIKSINEALIQFANNNKEVEIKINESSAANFVSKFNDWKVNNLEGRFSYKKANLKLGVTALTDAQGNPKEEVTQGRIGTKFQEGEPTSKYLYDTYAYDSPLEKQNMLASDISEIIVYGKIPRNSLSIPTTTGQSYSKGIV